MTCPCFQGRGWGEIRGPGAEVGVSGQGSRHRGSKHRLSKGERGFFRKIKNQDAVQSTGTRT